MPCITSCRRWLRWASACPCCTNPPWGATYGILTARPFWYSPTAPVPFILSAATASASLTMLVTLLSGRLMNKRMILNDVLNGVAVFIGFNCAAYLYLKMWSWAVTDYYSHVPEQQLGLAILDQHTPYNFTFWFGEVLFGAFIPMILLLWRRTRRNANVLMLSAIMIVAGLVINCWNMTLGGFAIPIDWSPGVGDIFPVNRYEPVRIEWLVAIGIVAYSWLAFTLGVRFLNLHPEAHNLSPG